jgi:hypothetical protein
MLHVTCDYCHREIVPGVHDRFVVKMEVYAATDLAELTDADLDQDHLEALAEQLEESCPEADELAPAFKNMRFDLCQKCHKRFLRDPLGKEAVQKFDFSKN